MTAYLAEEGWSEFIELKLVEIITEVQKLSHLAQELQSISDISLPGFSCGLEGLRSLTNALRWQLRPVSLVNLGPIVDEWTDLRKVKNAVQPTHQLPLTPPPDLEHHHRSHPWSNADDAPVYNPSFDPDPMDRKGNRCWANTGTVQGDELPIGRLLRTWHMRTNIGLDNCVKIKRTVPDKFVPLMRVLRELDWESSLDLGRYEARAIGRKLTTCNSNLYRQTGYMGLSGYIRAAEKEKLVACGEYTDRGLSWVCAREGFYEDWNVV